MPDTAVLKHHADLLDRTATRLGVDLQDAAISGQFAFDDIADAVLRCTQCPQPEACESWLATAPSTPEKAPHYCRNHDLLTALQGAAE